VKITAVLNPVSGGKAKDVFMTYFENTSQFYGIQTSVFETSGKNDFKKLTAFAKSELPDLLIAIGGDGTLALASMVAADCDISIGVIPFGSSNGLAKELGVNLDPKLAFDDVLKSRLVRKMDMLCINKNIRSIHFSDIGINARVINAYEKDDNRGMLTYGKYMAEELRNEEKIDYHIEANGETYDGRCVMILLANGRKFGTGVSITESGNPFDGVFEIAIVEDINFDLLLKAGLSAIDQFYTPQNVSKVITTNKAIIRFKEPQLLQADGETMGEYKELNVSILTGEVSLLTNQGNPYIS